MKVKLKPKISPNDFAIKLSKAKEFLDKAIKIEPANTTILNNLGTAHKELGDTEKAIFFYLIQQKK